MNKFNRLQLLGTSIILAPVLLVVSSFVLYKVNSQPKLVEVEEVVEVETPKPTKVDTVVVVKEVEVKPVVTPKPVVVPTPPVQPKVEPVKVQKDSVEVKVEVEVEIDTTSQV